MEKPQGKFKKLKAIALCMAAAVALSLVLPVKIPKRTLPANREYYLAIHYWATTDIGWFIVGDRDGLYKNEMGEQQEYGISIVGSDPLDTLSHAFLRQGVRVVLYGTMVETELGNGYTQRDLHCTGWDIWAESHMLDRRLLKYLNLYDLRWVDRFLV